MTEPQQDPCHVAAQTLKLLAATIEGAEKLPPSKNRLTTLQYLKMASEILRFLSRRERIRSHQKRVYGNKDTII